MTEQRDGGQGSTEITLHGGHLLGALLLVAGIVWVARRPRRGRRVSSETASPED